MAAVIIAVARNHEAAQTLRTTLVREGFPTDRVALVSPEEPGPAGLVPGTHRERRWQDYFRQLLDRADEADRVAELVSWLRRQAAVIAVQPRGRIETEHALRVLRATDPPALFEHDLDEQLLEQAASPAKIPVVRKLLPKP
ncbi:MAG TPA: hypothetical protein VMT29_11990 [Steroidobacteraceae bacterium]|nr:hypothetical protein [Steroidobacteraceae bacterium]